MAITEIKDLDLLLKPKLGNKTVISHTTKPLTAAGENYGSTMLAVDVSIKNNDTNETEELNLVAKLVPKNEWIQNMFNTPSNFRKEIGIYHIIGPLMQEFQREQGMDEVIDVFPEYYGGRLGLGESFDQTAVFLLENLKVKGFDVADRLVGFDFETTEVILKNLAVFHAVPIAMKLLKPDFFQEKIRPFLKREMVFNGMSEEVEQMFNERTIRLLKQTEDCVPLIPNVLAGIKRWQQTREKLGSPREPFATIRHNDFWVNNTMIRKENNKTVQNKMVDFQIIDYGSPASDVVFLLYSSVPTPIILEHYDHFIKLYYSKLVDTLERLKCDIEPFTFELFQEELTVAARSWEFWHVMMMLQPILAEKGAAKDLDDFKETDMVADRYISDQFVKKLATTVLEFAKRNWI